MPYTFLVHFPTWCEVLTLPGKLQFPFRSKAKAEAKTESQKKKGGLELALESWEARPLGGDYGMGWSLMMGLVLSYKAPESSLPLPTQEGPRRRWPAVNCKAGPPYDKPRLPAP